MSRMRNSRDGRRDVALWLLLLICSSCGFGTAGVAALASDSNSGGNAAPSLGGFEVRGLAIAQPKVVEAILTCLGHTTRAPPIAPAQQTPFDL